MTPPADAIRARRRLTNKLIAARDAARLRPFFSPDVKLIVGDGALIVGADAMIEAFAGQFRDPDFVAYVRTPDTVELDGPAERAVEQGRWIAQMKLGGALVTYAAGPYTAVWRKAVGQWLIESELYVTLG
jgi:ketosteroid isomerase-like protein